ncbi:putative F-box/FBD/LRR-repeat protein At5g44950 [Arabidopsis lyrata subsp. lyrata]|uniref:putative F-box/FBD/LRR-repeat protein At5g44950 n=1 Tax=Arabidopsis lyrata subsp. lyrata TaxID=81972 RepID=UPI000A29B986|nr:putative F-box/FBD/LRR-repeat protein At5g44950 [Arabidopsis lyrata subsp. lyrata]|eukprot:XP_020882965.1 putative F-box/FBD/LRR-repeat protein At5g44950 [Arabidopsis lyrata subsp. lyrata]
MECDRISALPDSLIAMILSYLPIGDSVKTSVLSKRWEFLWLEVSRLDLDAINFSRDGEALARFMHMFVELNRGSSKILKNDDSIDDCNKRVMEWITEVVHRGVQHLDVEAVGIIQSHPGFNNIMYSPSVDFMPKYVYVSKTLVSLKLVNVGLEDPKFVVSLPSLKIMHLENIYYKSHGGLLIIKMLISASPVLEDLTLDFPDFTEPKEIVFWQEFSFSVPSPTMPKSNFDLVQGNYFTWKPEEMDLTNVPRCMKSTLVYVKINKLITKEESGIKVVNYFLENSAVLKKLTMFFTHSSMEIQEPESYMKLLTSTKLSRNCQVFIH